MHDVPQHPRCCGRMVMADSCGIYNWSHLCKLACRFNWCCGWANPCWSRKKHSGCCVGCVVLFKGLTL